MRTVIHSTCAHNFPQYVRTPHNCIVAVHTTHNSTVPTHTPQQKYCILHWQRCVEFSKTALSAIAVHRGIAENSTKTQLSISPHCTGLDATLELWPALNCKAIELNYVHFSLLTAFQILKQIQGSILINVEQTPKKLMLPSIAVKILTFSSFLQHCH